MLEIFVTNGDFSGAKPGSFNPGCTVEATLLPYLKKEHILGADQLRNVSLKCLNLIILWSLYLPNSTAYIPPNTGRIAEDLSSPLIEIRETSIPNVQWLR